MPEIRGEPSARNVAIVLCLPASKSRRTRPANSGSACSTSFHVAMATVWLVAAVPDAAQPGSGAARIGGVTDYAIVVADPAGTITWWSPGAEALFGHSAAAALGQSLDLIVPAAFRARHWAGFQRAMEAPQVKDLAADMPVLCADGQVKEFPGRLLVLSDGLGAALGAMGIFIAGGTTGIRPFR
jgi:PAS domain S-box-containing protein